jgi:hypothetical protein
MALFEMLQVAFFRSAAQAYYQSFIAPIIVNGALDLTASDAAQLKRLSRRCVPSIFLRIRERISEECERASPFAACEVEVDESYSALAVSEASVSAGLAAKSSSSASSNVTDAFTRDCA